jgi:dTDP-4-dehydrorhamnose 3,5-epimerase
MLYVPKGFAHGYQSLTDGSEVMYMVTQFYTPGAERGLRWNDPAFGIPWPLGDPILSPKDAVAPDFTP